MYEGKMCPQQFSDPNFTNPELAFCFKELCIAWEEGIGCVIIESARQSLLERKKTHKTKKD